MWTWGEITDYPFRNARCWVVRGSRSNSIYLDLVMKVVTANAGSFYPASYSIPALLPFTNSELMACSGL
jgi:hypothetical protein